MTLAGAILAFATSFAAWYIARHEHSVVYPFDETRTAPAETGETRLTEGAFTTDDGERLVVWTAAPGPDRPMVLYLPGNAGTLADRTPRFTWLIDRGYGVTAIAYRGSSGSTGRPDEAALTADARAIAADLDARLDAPLILFGESLGTAVAVKLAAAGIGDAVVLKSPFTSITDLVTAQFPGEDLTGLFTEKWETEATVAKVRQPLLILHGSRDPLVPLEQGRAVYDRATSPAKTLVVLQGGGHAGAWTPAGLAALEPFLAGLEVTAP